MLNDLERKNKKNAFLRVFRLLPNQRPTMFWGSINAFLMGTMLPCFSIVFGEMFNVFFEANENDMPEEITKISLSFASLGLASQIFGFFQMTAWSMVGENLAIELRLLTFESIVRQEIAFFDQNRSGNILNQLTTQITTIQSGAGEKIALLIMNFSQALTGVAVAFYYSWNLTLVLGTLIPLVLLANGAQVGILARATRKSNHVLSEASSIASEVITSFRTVVSFQREEYFSQLYSSKLYEATKNRKRSHASGIGFGFSWLCIFATYAIGFWYGGSLVIDDQIKVGDLLVVFFSIVMSGNAMGQAAQLTPDIGRAQAAAHQVWALIDRTPKLLSGNEIPPENFQPTIEFAGVSFSYPVRPDVPVLSGVSFIVHPGQTVALVGSSGSGKSTIVSLIERFYDPTAGEILLGGIALDKLDIHWLRSHMGLVSQEPTLFALTIRENIRFGDLNATDEEIIEAAQAANAHDFIIQLPDGYETEVGERGTQLSGGQKQRIAIARAILKAPPILLLDEATSALDSESERLVQEALERMMETCTTIIVAHRLSTIRNAHHILVMADGKIVEEGTHESLTASRGIYYGLSQRDQSANVDLVMS